MYLVITTSLKTDSRSRRLAQLAHESLLQHHVDVTLIDLNDLELPFCNAGDCYGHPQLGPIARQISEAQGILLATPIYNYDAAASAKNLIELTGKAWSDKVVGFLCAAGGFGSYMSIMSLANSLMLDFRCLVLPRFVYATGDAFDQNELVDPQIHARIHELAEKLVKVSQVY